MMTQQLWFITVMILLNLCGIDWSSGRAMPRPTPSNKITNAVMSSTLFVCRNDTFLCVPCGIMDRLCQSVGTGIARCSLVHAGIAMFTTLFCAACKRWFVTSMPATGFLCYKHTVCYIHRFPRSRQSCTCRNDDMGRNCCNSPYVAANCPLCSWFFSRLLDQQGRQDRGFQGATTYRSQQTLVVSAWKKREPRSQLHSRCHERAGVERYPVRLTVRYMDRPCDFRYTHHAAMQVCLTGQCSTSRQRVFQSRSHRRIRSGVSFVPFLVSHWQPLTLSKPHQITKFSRQSSGMQHPYWKAFMYLSWLPLQSSESITFDLNECRSPCQPSTAISLVSLVLDPFLSCHAGFTKLWHNTLWTMCSVWSRSRPCLMTKVSQVMLFSRSRTCWRSLWTLLTTLTMQEVWWHVPAVHVSSGYARCPHDIVVYACQMTAYASRVSQAGLVQSWSPVMHMHKLAVGYQQAQQRFWVIISTSQRTEHFQGFEKRQRTCFALVALRSFCIACNNTLNALGFRHEQ